MEINLSVKHTLLANDLARDIEDFCENNAVSLSDDDITLLSNTLASTIDDNIYDYVDIEEDIGVDLEELKEIFLNLHKRNRKYLDTNIIRNIEKFYLKTFSETI